MIRRLAAAYGCVIALAGTLLIAVFGLTVHTLSIAGTRQPLPLVWPIAVIHVTVCQIPLRDVFEPLERAAVRGVTSRLPRAALSLALLMTGLMTYVITFGHIELATLFLTLAAIGMVTATRHDPWAWTLGGGMVIVGFQFLTPLEPVTHLLTRAPIWIYGTAVGLTATAYVLRPTVDTKDHPRARPAASPPRRGARSATERIETATIAVILARRDAGTTGDDG